MTNYHDPSDKSKPQEIYNVYTGPNEDGSYNVVGPITNKDNGSR